MRLKTTALLNFRISQAHAEVLEFFSAFLAPEGEPNMTLPATIRLLIDYVHSIECDPNPPYRTLPKAVRALIDRAVEQARAEEINARDNMLGMMLAGTVAHGPNAKHDTTVAVGVAHANLQAQLDLVRELHATNGPHWVDGLPKAVGFGGAHGPPLDAPPGPVPPPIDDGHTYSDEGGDEDNDAEEEHAMMGPTGYRPTLTIPGQRATPTHLQTSGIGGREDEPTELRERAELLALVEERTTRFASSPPERPDRPAPPWVKR